VPDKPFASAAPPAVAILLLLAAAGAAAELVVSEGTNLAVDASPVDRRIAMDLLGSIWILPDRGGKARRITEESQAAARPRWSPDGGRILYQASLATGSAIRVYDLGASSTRNLGDGASVDQDPDWHPDGQRIVFSSDRHGSGFDLWETDLPSGVSWRLTHRDGDETEPAWSADGRDLVYVHRGEDQWRLVLRPHGRAEVDLVVSDEPLAAPAWRPDGSLLTFLRRNGRRYSLEMVILSDPPLVRTLAEHQDFFLAPAAWVDRLHFLYTADGAIKSRGINERGAKEIDFQAAVALPESGAAAAVVARDLPVVTPPHNRIVIRARRIFDGREPVYRGDTDILIEGGTIGAVAPRRDWEDAPVLDLGDATVLPGLIDIWSTLPDGEPRRTGLQLLSFGVTTVVSEGLPELSPESWESEQSPGPRLLRAVPVNRGNTAGEPALVTIGATMAASPEDRERVAGWQALGIPVLAESWAVGRRVGADLAVGSAALPVSPLGRRYEDLRMTAGGAPITRVSGLADIATPGVDELLQSRQAQALPSLPVLSRRFTEPPALYGAASAIVAGSRPNRMPAGLALHAELRALTAAGLSSGEALQAAGTNAARLLGFEHRLGRIAPGAVADLVLVRGDPLGRIEDALEIVAVVRNGRFYSLARLLEMAEAADDVG
jgi:hypothetical protein